MGFKEKQQEWIDWLADSNLQCSIKYMNLVDSLMEYIDPSTRHALQHNVRQTIQQIQQYQDECYYLFLTQNQELYQLVEQDQLLVEYYEQQIKYYKMLHGSEQAGNNERSRSTNDKYVRVNKFVQEVSELQNRNNEYQHQLNEKMQEIEELRCNIQKVQKNIETNKLGRRSEKLVEQIKDSLFVDVAVQKRQNISYEDILNKLKIQQELVINVDKTRELLQVYRKQNERLCEIQEKYLKILNLLENNDITNNYVNSYNKIQEILQFYMSHSIVRTKEKNTENSSSIVEQLKKDILQSSFNYDK